VSLAPGEALSAQLPFTAAAAKQITAPALPPGRLGPGRYTLTVTAPVLSAPPVSGQVAIEVRR
jgi:hypothetical protein